LKPVHEAFLASDWPLCQAITGQQKMVNSELMTDCDSFLLITRNLENTLFSVYGVYRKNCQNCHRFLFLSDTTGGRALKKVSRNQRRRIQVEIDKRWKQYARSRKQKQGAQK
jgi:hypothetical protein